MNKWKEKMKDLDTKPWPTWNEEEMQLYIRWMTLAKVEELKERLDIDAHHREEVEAGLL